MKKTLFIFALIFLNLLNLENAYALFYIIYPSDQCETLLFKRATSDDAGDVNDTYSNDHQYFVSVGNIGRRYVGVGIKRQFKASATGTTIEEIIDNGVDDRLILPGTSVVELKSLAHIYSNLSNYINWLRGFQYPDEWDANYYCSATRNYLLPVPKGLPPGTKVSFFVNVVGAGPPIVDAEEVEGIPDDLENDAYLGPLTRESLWCTMFYLFAMPMFKMFVPIDLDDTFKQQIYLDLYSGFQKSKKMEILWCQGNYSDLGYEIMKLITTSKTIENMVKTRFGDRGKIFVKKILRPISKFFAKVELWEVYRDTFITGTWWETFYVEISVPKINEIIPNTGDAGDIVTIRGSGFDPYFPEKNEVYFSSINHYPAVKAQIVEVPNEGEIRVKVPTNAYPGPVQVEVDGLKSNMINFADEFKATVRITSPENGATLDSLTTLVAEIVDPPSYFPENPATRRLFIDNIQVGIETQVQSTEFNYTLDVESMAAGIHTALVEVDFPGHTVSDGISFYKETSGVIDLSAFNRVRVDFNTVNPYTINKGETLYDDRTTSLIWGQTGSFDGDKYTLNWTNWPDTGVGNVKLTLEIEITFNTNHDLITDMTYKYVEDDQDEDSVYYMEEYFNGISIPVSGVQTETVKFRLTGNSVCEHISGYHNYQWKNINYIRMEETGTCDKNTFLEVTFYKTK